MPTPTPVNGTDLSVPVDQSPASDTSDVAVLHHHLVRIIRTLRTSGPGHLSAGVTSGLWTIIQHGPLRLSELAAREGVTLPSMSRIVASLEQQGYIQRTPDPDDGRARQLVATEAGTEMINQSRSTKARMLWDALNRLDPQTREQVQLSIQALADALAEVRPPAIPD